MVFFHVVGEALVGEVLLGAGRDLALEFFAVGVFEVAVLVDFHVGQGVEGSLADFAFERFLAVVDSFMSL